MKNLSCSASPSSFSISLFTTSPMETIPSNAFPSIITTCLILLSVIISIKSEELTVFRAEITDLVIIVATFSLVISTTQLLRFLTISRSETIPMTSSFLFVTGTAPIEFLANSAATSFIVSSLDTVMHPRFNSFLINGFNSSSIKKLMPFLTMIVFCSKW